MIARAPGRVNLIGDHTDYNGGFVLPMAIAQHALVAVGAARGAEIVVHSVHFDQQDSFKPETVLRTGNGWRDYFRGVLSIAHKIGLEARPCEVVIDGDVPLGSGLSSSAALEVAVFTALDAFNNWELPRIELAKLSLRVENEFVGVKCGIMDPLISVFAVEDCALLVDCQSLAFRSVPMDLAKSGVQVAILFSDLPRTLASTAYNQRRQECEEGLALLAAAIDRRVETLREVSPQEFEAHQSKLPLPIRARVRHVMNENERVQKAVRAAERNDLTAFGRLMDQSHQSLRDDFAVSCDELDLLVGLARKAPGILGARLTGGGFGGCAVALVNNDASAGLDDSLEEYSRLTGLTPTIWLCRAGPGATVITDDP